MKITHHLFGGLFFYTYICPIKLKHTHIMLFEFPTLVFPNDYKEDFETFFVQSTNPITKVEFVRYEDALIYLNGITKNESNCDDYTLDGYSMILGLQTINYVYEKNVIPYGFIPQNQGY